MTTPSGAALQSAIAHAIRQERAALRQFQADRAAADRQPDRFTTGSKTVVDQPSGDQRRRAALQRDRDNCVRLRKLHANRPDLLVRLAGRITHIDQLIFEGEREGRW
ncbi:hypothetical protein AWB91_09045 [Mycobacterium paraense]|uniref:Uncharacterized protein n=1 Tax=Mycobacterium paraense TaxID=767916 RepID=A0ABX3VSU1_9MYCO|nr:hypothetical protein [Mycobacterium paraense]ORW33262.1 hypothetical protein AWB91_09045 [Mycobacterium paraense]ORW34677.1 hypothetical protein AWB88_02730 [Mycobacterium paraense]